MPISLEAEQLGHLRQTMNKQRAKMLSDYSGYPITAPAVLKEYHELLLFYAAFPPDERTARLAEAELNRIAETIGSVKKALSAKWQHALSGTGIAQTELICSYSRPIAQWLVDKFPGSVGLHNCDAMKEEIVNIFQLLLPSIEFEVISQGKFNLSTRIRQASGFTKKTEQLEWLLKIIDERNLPVPVKDELYGQLKVYIRWTLDKSPFSRTQLRLPVGKGWFRENGLRAISSSAIIRQKNIRPVLLNQGSKEFLADSLKASLAFYCRETDAITYADPGELELFDMGRGLLIALTGMRKDKRLSLENYIGFMAFRNGIPVAYGGGWIWGQQCKIGVNIYPPFRKGESAWLFCQVLRLYYQHFGARHFIVNPNQFGKDNPDGLKSGAFWFYYKLGFRPMEEKNRQLAASEWEKIKANKNYRASIKTLSRFTSSALEWKTTAKTFPAFDAGELSRAMTHFIDHQYNNSRTHALRASVQRLKKLLPASSVKILSGHFKTVENWSLLAGLIPDLPDWNANEKKTLGELIQLKQTGKERDYILRMQEHRRLWKSLDNVVASFTQRLRG